jgi:hypothetical protein
MLKELSPLDYFFSSSKELSGCIILHTAATLASHHSHDLPLKELIFPTSSTAVGEADGAGGGFSCVTSIAAASKKRCARALEHDFCGAPLKRKGTTPQIVFVCVHVLFIFAYVTTDDVLPHFQTELAVWLAVQS